MKVRSRSGHLIFQPLETAFTMIQKLGSLHQKYDAGSDEYIADRTLTPMVLSPHYEVSGPDGSFISGDYTSSLVNVAWIVTGTSNGDPLTEGTHYQVDAITHALTLTANLDPDTSGSIHFTADFVDPRRKDVLKVEWEDLMSCVSESVWKVTLQSQWPMRTDLFPWKDRGTFGIPVQLYNGSRPLPDADCVYRWQVYESGVWRDIVPGDDLWCAGGQGTKVLQVTQKYLERVLIRCMAYPLENSAELQFTAFLLRRFYGYYDDDLDFVQGKYIFPETTVAAAESYVVNRLGGRFASPERYFDIEILYSRGDGHWWHVAHGTYGEVRRNMFPVDSTMSHAFGEMTRELSALLPLAFGGHLLTVGGAPIVAQVPVITRDID